MLDDTSPFETNDGCVLQRAKGSARCTFKLRSGQTVLNTLGQSGSLKLRLPRLPATEVPEAVLINTAGGLTGGDFMSFDGGVAARAHAIFTTQGAERAYRSLRGNAVVETRLTVGTEGFIEWLPQETILFDGSRLRRAFKVHLESNSKFLANETVIFGRTAMGERVQTGLFQDIWQVYQNGALVHADATSIRGPINVIAKHPSTLGDNRAIATVLYLAGDALAKVDQVRKVIAISKCEAGVSAWNGKLVCRAIAADGYALRRVIEMILTTIRNGRTLPRVWHI